MLRSPPDSVSDWAKIGLIRNVSSLEAAAEQLLHWSNTKKRDKAAKLIADAHAGKTKISDAKKAFEVAAKEARVWLPYKGP